ncbi:MAG: tRNA 2-thiocytidine(32) synthetase TtcA [Epsilonproteobacteria bacterium]|jgi:tRNA 2-thiocytidine biosynthesis protein TtcA|nr:tRNA 2-thiocytidine(32) synthetase TtcA [Campylobacterota bacterium]NPA89503.1 tRNA 2-thiocytidine(32) synthetase TtcA [Campylobacterota bacterium]
MEKGLYHKSKGLEGIFFSKKVVKFAGRTNGKYDLIREGDRILVGVSGGKDSFVLLHILNRMRLIAPFKFEILAITIDAGTGIDYTPLQLHCKKYNIPYLRYETPILEIIREKKREGSSICGFCARLRRGALYTKAKELGFNKIALGHHFDDAVETFFMGLFYNGIMKSMPPKYTAYNGIEVIRPLIKVREKWIEYMAQQNNFPIIDGESSCLAYLEGGEKTPYARKKIKEWVRQLEEENPQLFQRLESGFENIQCDTFFMPPSNFSSNSSPKGEK